MAQSPKNCEQPPLQSENICLNEQQNKSKLKIMSNSKKSNKAQPTSTNKISSYSLLQQELGKLASNLNSKSKFRIQPNTATPENVAKIRPTGGGTKRPQTEFFSVSGPIPKSISGEVQITEIPQMSKLTEQEGQGMRLEIKKLKELSQERLMG